MIVICPICRAPSGTHEHRCWVCRRIFDGTEPMISDVPGARAPLRQDAIREFESWLASEQGQRAKSA